MALTEFPFPSHSPLSLYPLPPSPMPRWTEHGLVPPSCGKSYFFSPIHPRCFCLHLHGWTASTYIIIYHDTTPDLSHIPTLTHHRLYLLSAFPSSTTGNILYSWYILQYRSCYSHCCCCYFPCRYASPSTKRQKWQSKGEGRFPAEPTLPHPRPGVTGKYIYPGYAS